MLKYLFILCSLSACTKSPKVQTGKIAQWLLKDTFLPLCASPNEEYVHGLSKGLDNFSLQVFKTGSKTISFETTSSEYFSAPNWTPGSQGITFLQDTNGDELYTLHHFNLQTGQVELLDNERTASRSYSVSPDGKMIAQIKTTNNEVTLGIQSFDKSKAFTPLTGGVGKNSPVEWARDGRFILSLNSLKDAFIVIDVESKQVTTVPTKSDINHVIWKKAGRSVLVTSRMQAEKYYTLKEYDLSSKKWSEVLSLPGNILSPVYLPNGQVYFQLRLDGESRFAEYSGDVVTYHLDGSASPCQQTNESVTVSHVGNDSASSIFKFKNKQKWKLAESHSAEPSQVFPSSDASFSSFDGLKIPAIIWTPQSEAHKWRGILIKVHGGPRGTYSKQWDSTTQYLIREDIAVAALNYRGSAGYTGEFERNAVTDNQVQDILHFKNFLVEKFKIPSSKLILFADSYGAVLTSATIFQESGVKATMLLATAGHFFHKPHWKDYFQKGMPEHIFMYHGKQDPMFNYEHTLAAGNKALSRSFVKPQQTLFEDEGHSFRKVKNWDLIYSAVEGLLPRN